MFRAFNFASKRCPVIDRHVTRLVPFFATHAAVLVHPYTSSPVPLYVSIIELLSGEQSVNRSGLNQNHRDRKEFRLSVIYRPRVSGPRVSPPYFVRCYGYERAPLSRVILFVISEHQDYSADTDPASRCLIETLISRA